jgi:hypothetical protein
MAAVRFRLNPIVLWRLGVLLLVSAWACSARAYQLTITSTPAYGRDS